MEDQGLEGPWAAITWSLRVDSFSGRQAHMLQWKDCSLVTRDSRKILCMNITHVMCQGSKISSLEVASSAWRLLRVVVVLQVVLDTSGETCSKVTAITFNGWRTVSLWRSQWFLWRTIGFRDRASWSRGSEMHHVMTSCDHLLHFRCRVSTHAAHWNNEQPFRVQFVGWGRNCGECGQTFGRAVKTTDSCQETPLWKGGGPWQWPACWWYGGVEQRGWRTCSWRRSWQYGDGD